MQGVFHVQSTFFEVGPLNHLAQGFQVSPSELEGHIRKHVFVKDVAVVGKPDERCGEVPVAFVVLSDVGLEELERAVDIQESIMQSVQADKVGRHVVGVQLAIC